MRTEHHPPDDVKAAPEFIVSGGRVSGKATERILAALAAARERGAREAELSAHEAYFAGFWLARDGGTNSQHAAKGWLEWSERTRAAVRALREATR